VGARIPRAYPAITPGKKHGGHRHMGRPAARVTMEPGRQAQGLARMVSLRRECREMAGEREHADGTRCVGRPDGEIQAKTGLIHHVPTRASRDFKQQYQQGPKSQSRACCSSPYARAVCRKPHPKAGPKLKIKEWNALIGSIGRAT